MEPYSVFYWEIPGVKVQATVMATSLDEARALAFWRYGDAVTGVWLVLYGATARAVGGGNDNVYTEESILTRYDLLCT